MTILITGATGLVGTELVHNLLAENHTIHYLTTSKHKLLQKENYKGFYWNPTKQEIDVNAFDQVDAIIHLSGASVAKKWTSAYKNEIRTSRIQSTQLLFKTLQTIPHTVKQIITASAIGIYPSSLEKIYHETDTQVDASFLGEVVESWENEVTKFETLGILVTKIRIGIVLAKNGGALQEMIKPIKIGFGAALGSGKQYQSWIHIHDLIAIFKYVLLHHKQGVYNAVAPYPVTNSALTKAIARVLNKPLFLPSVPTFILKILLGEMHVIVTSSQHVSCMKLLDEGFQFKYASIDKALHQLLKS